MNRGHNAKVENGTLADDKPAFRGCLGRDCQRLGGKLFWSKGPANRHCPKCDAKREAVGGVYRAREPRE